MAVLWGGKSLGHLSRKTTGTGTSSTLAAPVLSSPTDAATSPTGASASVVTDTPSGTLYWFVWSSSTAPIVDAIKSGAGSTAHGSQAVTFTGTQNVTVSGLSASTPYYTYFLQTNGNDSDIVSTGGFTTLDAPDTIAPTLSSPSSAASGATTGSSSVATDEANGTIYAYLSSSATPPTASNLKAGTLAVASGNRTVTVIGTQTFNWTGLTTGNTYYTHWLHTDAANNDSTIISDTVGFTTVVVDTTPPTLSAPAGITNGATTATVRVTTNEGNGMLYAYVYTSSSAPTTANLKSGSGAVWSGNQLVSSTGAKTFSVTGLTDATPYYVYFLHTDAANNDSSIDSASFTTDALGAGPAISAPTLAVSSTSPLDISFTRPIDWADGCTAVMQVSKDSTFATGVVETTNTMYAATTSYNFGLSTIRGGPWYFRMAAWNNSRPSTLNWSNTVSATTASVYNYVPVLAL